MTKRQRQKLYLHEMCAHEGFHNLNQWIRHGRFPHIDPSLALEPDPMCPSCTFSKARRLSHNSYTGHISKDHTILGEGVSSDGLESGTPGRPFTTKGSASKLRYQYVSFWVDHATSFVPFIPPKQLRNLSDPSQNLNISPPALTSKSKTSELIMAFIVLNYFGTPVFVINKI
jgi:hypothetical protein